tara:strand:+ start:285 stop:569 length:285 start_codon:yes stop_codon:yes gene_type:complete
MSLDHDAIYKAYPNVVTIYDDRGAFDGSNNLVSTEQSKIDEARVELNKLKYQEDRRTKYPDFADQLDMIYHDQVNGTSTFKDAIAKVKSDNPKP